MLYPGRRGYYDSVKRAGEMDSSGPRVKQMYRVEEVDRVNEEQPNAYPIR